MNKVSLLLAAAALTICATSCCNNSTKEPSEAENTEQVMTKQSDNFIFADQTRWDDAGGGVVRQVMGYNDNIMMVKVKFTKARKAPCTAIPTHR